MTSMTAYESLLARLAEIGHIRQSLAVLGWDQQCYMPPGGAAARANQFATLGKIGHELFCRFRDGDALRKGRKNRLWSPG